MKQPLIYIVIVLSVLLTYLNLHPTFMQSTFGWHTDSNALSFDLSLGPLAAQKQSDLIKEYLKKGHDLECFGSLLKEEKIAETNDYLCVADIQTAYNNIPAQSFVFFFSKGRLTHVRLELPASSQRQVLSYFNKNLSAYPRLDRINQMEHGTSNSHQPLARWVVKHGIVTTDRATPTDRPMIVLWSYSDKRITTSSKN